jgi:hypothetical protein
MLHSLKLSCSPLVALTKEPVLIFRLTFHHALYCIYVDDVAASTGLIIPDTGLAVLAYSVHKMLAKPFVTNPVHSCARLCPGFRK